MKKAVGYARLSQDKQGSVSIEYQTDSIKALAKAHGFKLIGIETDLVSGKSIKKRPGVQRVIQAIESKQVDALLVFKSDRLSRNGLESLSLEKLLASNGVGYISHCEGVLIGQSTEDKFMSYIRAGLNERERELHSMRLKRALAKRRELGQTLGHQARYGFSMVDGKVVENPSERPLVNRIHQLKSAGHSLRSIAEILTSEGFKTRKGSQFSHRQVHLILNAA